MRHYFGGELVQTISTLAIRETLFFGKGEHFLEESLNFGEGIVKLVDGVDTTGISNLLLGGQLGVIVQEKQILLDLLVVASLEQMQKVGFHLFAQLLGLAPLRMEFNQFLRVGQLDLPPSFFHFFGRVFIFHDFHGNFVLRVQSLQVEWVVGARIRIHQRVEHVQVCLRVVSFAQAE